MGRPKAKKPEPLTRIWIDGVLLDQVETLALTEGCNPAEREDPSPFAESEPFFDFPGERLTPHDTLIGSLNRCIQRAWASPDGREAPYVQPTCDAAGIVIERKFSFVAFRFVKYQWEEVLISWCNNAFCPDHLTRSDAQSLFQGADFPDRAADEHLDGIQRLCYLL